MSLECEKLHQLVNQLSKYNIDELNDSIVPSDGIYFIMENGEVYKEYNRIVRVGFNRKKGNLPNKIQNVLWGNSSFRKHMTRAIKKKYKNLKGMDEINVFLNKYIVEKLGIAFIKIDSSNVRKRIVRRAIKCLETAKQCEASPEWLGRNSSKIYIRKKGLWHLKNFKVLSSEKLDEIDLEFLSLRMKKRDNYQQEK
jgi:hypothetical protein